MSLTSVFCSPLVRVGLVTLVAIVSVTQAAAAPLVVDTISPGSGTLGSWLLSLQFWGFWGR